MTFEKTLFLSVLLHAVILSALAITLKKPYITPRPYEVDLVSPAGAGRPEKPAPDKIKKPAPEKQQAQPVARPPQPVEKKAAMPPVIQEKRPARQSRQSSTLLQQELARIQRTVDVEQAINGVAKKVKPKRKLLISNNKNSKTRGSGARPGTGDNTALNGYFNQVTAAIMRNWYLPDAKIHGITATVTIDIQSNGTLTFKGFEKRSGNSLLDSSAVRAVQRTVQVPPPPGVLPLGGLEVGLIFNPDNR